MNDSSKPATPAPPPNRHRLSPEELEALREDAKQASAWCRAQLAASDTRLSPEERESLRDESKRDLAWMMAQPAKLTK